MAGKFKVLTIDGGGIRGIIPATVIATLEQLIQKKTGTNDKIGDYFDFIAGTSTGGILSCVCILFQTRKIPGKRVFQQMMHSIYIWKMVTKSLIAVSGKKPFH